MSQLPTIDEEESPSRQEQTRKIGRRFCINGKPLEQMTKALLGSILACSWARSSRSEQEELLPSTAAGAAAATAAAATAEAQGKLAKQQETIDMLEWQLEYLQSVADREMGTCCVKIVQCMEHRGDESDVKNSSGADVQVLQNPSRHSDHHTSSDLLLEVTIVRATLAIRRFCKVFMKQLEASGYSVWRALSDLEPKTSFQLKGHTSFALESRLNRILFRNFEKESFDELGITTILDPSERALRRLDEFQKLRGVEALEAFKLDAEFAGFCGRMTKELWKTFSWNIVFENNEERSGFTNAFMDACRGVWLLHRLAFSMDPSLNPW